MLSKGLLYVTVQKIQECVGGTSYYEELTGEEGEVRVPAQNIVPIDVVLVSRKMPRSEFFVVPFLSSLSSLSSLPFSLFF